MVLEELHGLIETLQARISEHASALQQSEPLTRYALIDPMLRALNWDTADPSQVLVEYRSDAGQADYALIGQAGKPEVIIEAKRLGTQLDQRVRQQVTSYCQEEGVPFAVITNGKRWEIYDIFLRAALKDSVVATLDLGDAPAKTCLQALALWRPGVVTGNVKPAADSIFDAPSTSRGTPQHEEFPHGVPVAETDTWQSLSEYTHKGGEKPAQLRLPSGEVVGTSSRGQVTKEIVQWLTDQASLSAQYLPIRTSSGKVLVAEQSATPALQNSSKVGSFLVNTSFTAQPQVVNCRTIIERVGLDPGDFAVRLR